MILAQVPQKLEDARTLEDSLRIYFEQKDNSLDAQALKLKAKRQKNGAPNLFVSPNPSYGHVLFFTENLKKDSYEVRVFNIIGIELWKSSFLISGDRTLEVDLSHLRKGTYFYSLKNSYGQIITTKRLVILGA
jgi:hypothetical protein